MLYLVMLPAQWVALVVIFKAVKTCKRKVESYAHLSLLALDSIGLTLYLVLTGVGH